MIVVAVALTKILRTGACDQFDELVASLGCSGIQRGLLIAGMMCWFKQAIALSHDKGEPGESASFCFGTVFFFLYLLC